MKASGRLGMRLHQAVSFSRAMIYVPPADAVFFPGCALLTYDPALLNRTLAILRQTEPDIALACGCCGQPTKYLESRMFQRRTAKLMKLFEQQGVKRIYTACPNCTKLLSNLHGANVIPVWETLNQIVTPENLQNQNGAAFALHDPCPVRTDLVQQDAVRSLMSKARVTIAEFPQNRESTQCCGNIAMLRARDPEKSAVMRASRLNGISSELPVTSYCAGCVDAFSSDGRNTAHLIELLFGRSKKRGWSNRIRNTILSRKG